MLSIQRFDKNSLFIVAGILLNENDKKIIRKTIKNVEFFEYSIKVDSKRIKKTSWPIELIYKYFLPWDERFLNVDRIIFFGADMIIKKDISFLFRIDIDDKAFCAAVELDGNIYNRNALYDESYFDSLYVNAELVVYNLAYMRNKYTIDNVFNTFLSMQNILSVFDQDFINFAFCNEIKRINFLYNLQLREFLYFHDFKNAIKNAYVLHFSDNPKPWRLNCKPIYAKIYLKNISDSRFKRKILIYLILDYFTYFPSKIFYKAIRMLKRRKV